MRRAKAGWPARNASLPSRVRRNSAGSEYSASAGRRGHEHHHAGAGGVVGAQIDHHQAGRERGRDDADAHQEIGAQLVGQQRRHQAAAQRERTGRPDGPAPLQADCLWGARLRRVDRYHHEPRPASERQSRAASSEPGFSLAVQCDEPASGRAQAPARDGSRPARSSVMIHAQADDGQLGERPAERFAHGAVRAPSGSAR